MPMLVKPSVQYKDSFIAAIREFKAEEEQYFSIVERIDVEEIEQDFAAYVEVCLSESDKPLKPKWVKATHSWLVEGDEVLGLINIRHDLNDNLRRTGGHIGVGVRPSQRRKGYASLMTRQALIEARKVGLTKVMFACKVENTGSQKILKSFGAVLENIVKTHETDPEPTMMRWWIDLNKHYDYKALLQVFINAQKQNWVHEDFEKYHTTMLAKLEEAFGIELSKEGLASYVETYGGCWMYWGLIKSTVDNYMRGGVPGYGFIEGGPLAGLEFLGEGRPRSRMYQLKGDDELNAKQAQIVRQAHRKVEDLHNQYKKALLELLYSHFELLYGKVETIVTSEDLLALGFDDSKEPQIKDYYDYI
jgi:predicted acetyltransferase